MKNITYICFALCLILSACDKDRDNTSASGRVLQYGTNIPIEGAEVYLQRCSGDGTFSGSSFFCEIIDTIITTTNGEYDFPDISTDGIYLVTGEADQYYEYQSNLTVRERQANVNDIILTPYAWVELYIVNENPVDEYDQVQIASELGLSWTTFSGIDISEQIIFQSRGNTEGFIRWDVSKNGIETVNRDTIIVPAHDTLIYKIGF